MAEYSAAFGCAPNSWDSPKTLDFDEASKEWYITILHSWVNGAPLLPDSTGQGGFLIVKW